MAATSIATQLKALKSLVKTDFEAAKKPITRPSILFDSKEAADLDIDSILSIALSGLEVLVNIDERFRNFKSDLFSHKSRELDRELMAIEENNRINGSISSYLRLLSGHLQSPSAFKTLEYLVRRYKIHVYNIEELILCALPYHDTHAFVRIVQLINLGNSRWKFLDGVKASGAPPPRGVIVQQCIRDMGVLEIICNYATPARKSQPSTPVISFSTAVVVEVLGSLATVDSEVVKRIIPFLNPGLQSGGKGSSDYKAGTLMIVGLLANRVALSSKLVSSLLRSVAELARADTQASGDAQWLQLSIMAFINIVQLQSVETLPKKVLDNLKEVGDLPSILLPLTKRFNIDRFLTLLLESLIEYSHSDRQCQLTFESIIETVAISSLIQGIVYKLLSSCLRLSQNADASELSDSGRWVKQILLLLTNKYPNELRTAVHEFFEDKKVQLKGDCSVIDALCKMLDGNLKLSVDFPDSRIWFALEHPKAEIRRVTLSNLDLSTVLDGRVSSQGLVTVQDAIARCLSDSDLSVVHAALSVPKLSKLIESTVLLKMFQNLLCRCTQILWSGASTDPHLAGEVAVSCLKHTVSLLQEQSHLLEEIATMILPFLLVFPKTKTLNLKAQELAKEIKWPFYRDLICASGHKKDLKKKTGREWLSAVNMATIQSLVDVFSASVQDFMPWLIKCCGEFETSKTLVFLVLLQSFSMQRNASAQFITPYEAYFSFLKTEWRALEHAGNFFSGQEFSTRILESEIMDFLVEFDEVNLAKLNGRILVSVFWRSIKAHLLMMPTNVAANDDDGRWVCALQDLYVFFSESNPNHLFKEHRHYLVQNCNVTPFHFLSSFISEQGVSSAVQVESLHSCALLCSQADEALTSQLLAGFPLILVPLSSDVQDVRTAAMNYVEELNNICSVKHAGKRNAKGESWRSCISELLNLLVQQKKLILSDRDFLPSFFAFTLSSSFQSLVVPQDVGQRFDKSTIDCLLDFILGSAMKFPGYAKLKVLSLLRELGSAIMHVKDVESLLCQLLQRRRGYQLGHDKSLQELSSYDVDTLCLLIEICSLPTPDLHIFEDHILPKLLTDGMLPDATAIIRPCVAFLQTLNGNLYSRLSAEMQQNLFRHLILLYHNANADVQNATRDVLLRLDISCSIVAHTLNSVLAFEGDLFASSHRKKKKSAKCNPDMFFGGQSALTFLSSLLDMLLLKKEIQNRALFVEPLFQLLRKAFSNEWVLADYQEEWVQTSFGVSQTMSNTLGYIQQTLLLILEDIIGSLPLDTSSSIGVFDKVDATLLVEFARSATDVTTRNHVYSVFATVAKVKPDKVLPHIPEIFVVLGESTVTQSDNHSKRVFEDFISAVVPCWLVNMGDADKLLQIFIKVMPDVAPQRRLSIILHLLKTLGEKSSMGSLLLLLFHSLVSKEKYSSLDFKSDSFDFISSVVQAEWEFNFAAQLYEQYTCMIWLPSLVSLLKHLHRDDPGREWFLELFLALKFILEKLDDPELVFKLQSMEGIETIQGTFSELMVQVVCCWQLFDLSGKKIFRSAFKKEFKELVHAVLIKIRKGMLPSAFFQGIFSLLVRDDKGAKKKALQVLCETVREIDVLRSKRDRRVNAHLTSSWHLLEGNDLDSFGSLCMEILQLLEGPNDLDVSVILAAISALEVLASKFPANHTVFSNCLASVVKNVLSDDLAVGSSCLRTIGTLVNVLGPRALPELPKIMKNVLKRTLDVPAAYEESCEGDTDRPLLKKFVVPSVLVTLEALVVNLGAFLNPYLGDIIELIVLNPNYISVSNQKLKPKADAVRKLLSEKVPIRLALPALHNVYPKAVKAGDMSLSTVFELLQNFVGTMEKSSVSGYHANIFDLCILALDLRSQHISSIKNVNVVEKHVFNAIITLTMKMTETMFKPLFIRSIEWAELAFEEDDHNGGRGIGRAISFYGLVDKLAENHRSLFVPYFKYLLEASVRYLTDGDGKIVDHSRKKKKAKLQKSDSTNDEANDALVLEKWHLRALVVSSLHKCFLYDTGSLKFLDSTKFELLLKPVVSQLVVEPPALLEEHPDIPSVADVDDALVSCLGQMAVTAGSDLLWRHLNYEVLLQTRSETVRTRFLGLRIVKRLVENLKEEYLVLLAEVIPFLAELLEDVEMPVKTLSQEILKELESLSGENLRQYF